MAAPEAPPAEVADPPIAAPEAPVSLSPEELAGDQPAPEAGTNADRCQREALEIRHPVHALSVPGGIPLESSRGFLKVEGKGVSVDAVKLPEASWSFSGTPPPAGARFVVRFHETEGKDTTVRFTLPTGAGFPVLVSGRILDLHERHTGAVLPATKGAVVLPLKAFGLSTVELEARSPDA